MFSCAVFKCGYKIEWVILCWAERSLDRALALGVLREAAGLVEIQLSIFTACPLQKYWFIATSN